MKILKPLLLLVGFYVLYLTVQKVGLQNIWGNILELKWQLLPVLSLYAFVYFFNTWGWSYSFPKSLPQHVSFRELYFIRMVGETLNTIIPWTASLGGEPMKAELLKRKCQIPLADTYASILIVHTTFWVSLNLFIIGGVLVTLKSFPLTPLLWKSVIGFLLLLGAGAAFLFWGIRHGVFSNIHGWLEKWQGASGDKKNRFLNLDREIREFYTKNKSRFYWSVFYNLLAWMTGIVEVYWVGNLLGMDISLGQAWLIEVLIQTIRIITFFIPASIGTQEGGIVLLFAQLGYAGTLGLTFALIRRIREIFWVGLILALWTLSDDRPGLAPALSGEKKN